MWGAGEAFDAEEAARAEAKTQAEAEAEEEEQRTAEERRRRIAQLKQEAVERRAMAESEKETRAFMRADMKLMLQARWAMAAEEAISREVRVVSALLRCGSYIIMPYFLYHLV